MYSYFCYDEIPESLQPSCLVWAFVNSLSTLSSNPTPSLFSRALGETLISDKKSEAGGGGGDGGRKTLSPFSSFSPFPFHHFLLELNKWVEGMTVGGGLSPSSGLIYC